LDRSQTRSHLFLIAGVALAAMTAGHALIVALTGASGYRHAVQVPAVDLAAVLAGAGVFGAVRRLFGASRNRQLQPDWALPSFETIRALGPVRIASAVLAIQMSVLIAGESLEQHLSGVALPGFAGVFGSTFAFAPLVHVAIGVACALLLWIASRETCRHAIGIIAFSRALIAWLARPLAQRALKPGRTLPAASLALSQPLAFNLANRPPPLSARLA
jgi:hypothetical protein